MDHSTCMIMMMYSMNQMVELMAGKLYFAF